MQEQGRGLLVLCWAGARCHLAAAAPPCGTLGVSGCRGSRGAPGSWESLANSPGMRAWVCKFQTNNFFFFLTAEKCGVAVSSIHVFGLKSEFYLLTESDFIKQQLGLVFIGPFQPNDY